mmetsp:Transcript_19352/g.30893  ORF Transcript_19352/g.30893 Transcript_19352/m.30893 type:complete len:107 (-) Transcript_19352:67-387(-)
MSQQRSNSLITRPTSRTNWGAELSFGNCEPPGMGMGVGVTNREGIGFFAFRNAFASSAALSATNFGDDDELGVATNFGVAIPQLGGGNELGGVKPPPIAVCGEPAP